jgi:flagellar biosynthesis/type III secretory pathway M-ring protein FliF/YscJ
MMLGGGALAVVLLAGGALFLMRRRAPAASAVDMAAGAIGAGAGQEISHLASADDLERQIKEGEAQQAKLESDIMSRIKLPAATKATEVLIRHVRESAQKDPVTAAGVLRTWMVEKRS